MGKADRHIDQNVGIKTTKMRIRVQKTSCGMTELRILENGKEEHIGQNVMIKQ